MLHNNLSYSFSLSFNIYVKQGWIYSNVFVSEFKIELRQAIWAGFILFTVKWFFYFKKSINKST